METINETYLINRICQGYSSSEIALELQMDESIIIESSREIYKKLNINDWKELIIYAIKNNQFID
jgi:DNA-binding NarL/FixJ family response regulator